MSNITIDRGESVSFGFEIHGIEISDLLDLQIYVGDWGYTLSNNTIIRDLSNNKLFYVKLNSKVTNEKTGEKPISLAIITDFLGVQKQTNFASLVINETNQITVLDELSDYISATFIVTVDLDQISTNVVLESIYRGAQGEQGIQGEAGLKGDTGEQGIQGEQGNQGEQGIQGEAGLKGDTGEQGIQGEQGTQGEQGIQGEAGLKGDTGEQGIQGIQGIQGQAAVPDNNGIVTIELDSTLTNFFYAPRNLKINSTTNINGTPTVTIKVNNVSYTLGASILRGALITLNSNVIGVVNLNIVYE
jgi:hypothetical protein